MHHIDMILYINLDRREDRRKEIEEELFIKANIDPVKVVRISAIHHRSGIVGCGLSHIKALETAMSMNEKVENVLILEDDFNFTSDRCHVERSLEELFEKHDNDWDVVLLSYSVRKRKDFNQLLSVSLDATKTDAYLIKRRYIPTLIENFQESTVLLERTGEHWKYALDVYWKHLMEKDRWFYFNHPLGDQRAGYSDISNSTVHNISRVIPEAVTIT